MKIDEETFAKELSCFETAMNNDLDARTRESSMRWNFDFNQGRPSEPNSATLKVEWEAISPGVPKQNRSPRLRIDRPKMKLNSILSDGVEALSNPFGRSSLVS